MSSKFTVCARDKQEQLSTQIAIIISSACRVHDLQYNESNRWVTFIEIVLPPVTAKR